MIRAVLFAAAFIFCVLFIGRCHNHSAFSFLRIGQAESATEQSEQGAGQKEKVGDSFGGRIKEGQATEITWDDLYEFDYKKGVATPFLKAINGKHVRLPGFVIPLSDGRVGELGEFLIVPEPMMCIHVPAPPPNLLVYATANPPLVVGSLWEPRWLEGFIKIEKKKSIYAEAGFTMKVTSSELYEQAEG